MESTDCDQIYSDPLIVRMKAPPRKAKSYELGIGVITWDFTVSFRRPCPCNLLQTQMDTEIKEAKQAAPGLLPRAGMVGEPEQRAIGSGLEAGSCLGGKI